MIHGTSCASWSGFDCTCDAAIKELQAKVAELQQCIVAKDAAIGELIDCKELKDSLRNATQATYLAIETDYKRRKPLAWKAAYAALKLPPSPESLEAYCRKWMMEQLGHPIVWIRAVSTGAYDNPEQDVDMRPQEQQPEGNGWSSLYAIKGEQEIKP